MKVRLFVLAVIAAVAAAAFLGFAPPSKASLIIGPAPINAAVQSVAADTSCNTSTRVMSLGVQVQLTLPYSYGAYVSFAFRYWRVNGAGSRISQVFTDSWHGPYFVTSYNANNGSLAGIHMTDAPMYPAAGPGHYEADVTIAVWDQSQAKYIITPWIHLSSYTTYTPTQYGTTTSNGFYCATSLIA